MAGANLPSVQDEEPEDGDLPMHEQPAPDTEEAGDMPPSQLVGFRYMDVESHRSQFELVMILSLYMLFKIDII